MQPREGRFFNPDEFAIALEQVVSGDAPEDYRNPAKFFARTCFTRALTDHAGMVLRRLAGETENAAPVMALLTQFGGGKTHTLAALRADSAHPPRSRSDKRSRLRESSMLLSDNYTCAWATTTSVHYPA